MCTYIIFSARRYVVLTASVKFRIGSPKTARNEQVCALCAPKVIQEVFPQVFFEQLYTGWIVVVHLYCRFSLWRQMAPKQSATFRTAFLVNFVPV